MTSDAAGGPALEAAMDRALELAARAGGRTSPNPMVGAVALRDGAVVAEALHAAAGLPHAEASVLADARRRGVDLRGATLVVNLEPCAHHGRTPPCAPALIAAGFGRVAAAMLDPNPAVGGRGLAQLREAGIEVVTGLRARAAARLNEGFARWVRSGLPFVHLKVAMLPDGTVDRGAGRPREISGVEARRWAHRQRHLSAAVLVGAGTLRADDPRLTVRELPATAEAIAWEPRRVVLSSDLSVDPRARAFRAARVGPAPLVIGAVDAPEESEARLRKAGVGVARVPRAPGGVSLPAAVALLGSRGIASVLVEGGPTLSDALLVAGLVDRLSVVVAGSGPAEPARPPGEGGSRTWRPPGGVAGLEESLVGAERCRLGADRLVTGLIRSASRKP